MEANEAMKAMARRIVNANSNYMNGLDRGQCNFSAEEVLTIALAAIMETQRLDVELAGRVVVEHCSVPTHARREIASAIRAGNHYGAKDA